VLIIYGERCLNKMKTEETENQNRYNGKSGKIVQSPMGAFDCETPRDREGSFEI